MQSAETNLLLSAVNHNTNDNKLQMGELPANFEPNNYTVICGRGQEAYNSVGNGRFRELVSGYSDHYSLAGSRYEKSAIVTEIIETVHSSGGCFVRRQKGRFCKVANAVSREKVGALFRVLLRAQYRSSTKAKADRKSVELGMEPQFNAESLLADNNDDCYACYAIPEPELSLGCSDPSLATHFC
jgi:hypothetical protein